MKKTETIYLLGSLIAVALVTALTLLLISAVGNRNEDARLPTTDVSGNSVSSSFAEEPAAPSEDNTAPNSAAHGEIEPAPPEESEQAPEDPGFTVPDDLSDILAEIGTAPEQLNEYGCRQLITVKSEGESARIDFYTLDNNTWTANEDLSCAGHVGMKGVSAQKREGDSSTPKGLYSVGEAFYINDKPDTGLDVFKITDDTYWVDDPASSYYNRRVEGVSEKDWNSAEHMIDYDHAYKYGFVINYNTDAEYGAGSAIFFHVSLNSTTGCVGTDEKYVLGYLAALQADNNPYIIIV